MDNSEQMLGLNVGDVHENQNISFEDNNSIRRKRFHLDSESSVDNEVSSLTGFIMGKRIKLENNSEDETTTGLMRATSCDELGDQGIILGSTASENMAPGTGDLPFASEDENGDEDGCVLIQHMDIKEPLTHLKKAVEETHGISLDGYEFYLQDTTLIDGFLFSCTCCSPPPPVEISPTIHNLLCDHPLLAGHKNLVEQCVQGCGTVQINLQLKIEDDGTKKINIIDVLKPSDSYLLATGKTAFSPDLPEEVSQPGTKENDSNSEQNLIRWVVDHNFKANQQKLNIPQDPTEWDVSHVRHWLLWAVRQFNLTGIKLADWKITGSQLCNLTLEDFKARVPYDPADIFWTHLELLRRCKFVDLVISIAPKVLASRPLPAPVSSPLRELSRVPALEFQHSSEPALSNTTYFPAVMQNPEDIMHQEEIEKKDKGNQLTKNIMRNREKKFKALPIATDPANHPVATANWGHRSGNNGQVQLWQFLLDLLTDKDHRECIQWLGAEGEFKLIEPERVAQLWGMRKNKPNMNYEKLSRALRYYYDGDMIAKVHGKRFVYKFVCDLKQLLGYSAYELNRLVIEAEMKALNASNDPIQHSIFGNREF